MNREYRIVTETAVPGDSRILRESRPLEDVVEAEAIRLRYRDDPRPYLSVSVEQREVGLWEDFGPVEYRAVVGRPGYEDDTISLEGFGQAESYAEYWGTYSRKTVWGRVEQRRGGNPWKDFDPSDR